MLSEADGRTVLVVNRGWAFYVMIASLLFWGVLASASLIQAVRGELGKQGTAGVAVWAVLASWSAVGVLYYRVGKRLVLDASGIRIVHGRRVDRSLRWDEITEIRYGTRRRPITPFLWADVPFLQVRTRRFRRRIYFERYGYRVPDGEFNEFCMRVAQASAMRGIRVLREHVPGGYLP